MLAENPVVTTQRFISSWRTTNPLRLAEEIASVSQETHRRPDNFYFIVNGGELIDSTTGRTINFARNSSLEITEGRVWDELKSWANLNEEGSVTWTSPRLKDVYPCDKVVFYQIAYTFEFPPQKVLLSTAILLDTPQERFDESLREKLVIKDTNYTLASLLEELGQNNNQTTKTPSQETINYFVSEIKSGRNAESIVQEMHRMGIVGEHSVSCPTRSVDALLNNSIILNFSKESRSRYVKKCPYCDKSIETVIEPGYRCSCGQVFEGVC